MIRVYIVIALYVLIPVVIIECFKRWTWMKKIGTVVAAYAVGILFALTGFVHFDAGTAEAVSFSKIQSILMSVTVPLVAFSFSLTMAPGIPSPRSSSTVPLMSTCCAQSAVPARMSTRLINNRLSFCIVLSFNE